MLTFEQKFLLSGSVFSPSAPVSNKDLFTGRVEHLRTAVNAINQIGQHVIVYGERGVGKTSLANIIQGLFGATSQISVRVNCDGNTTYETLFRTIISEIKLTLTRPGLGFNFSSDIETSNLDSFITGNKELSPNELRFLFRALSVKVLIIIDEFDRIEDQNIKRLMADTLKNFSDYSLETTFVLVGVSDSVEDLITAHQSTERALVQIQMPRMSPSELEGIIDNGLKKLEMEIDDALKSKLVKLAQGLPHYMHLLSLHASQSAIDASRSKIIKDDVDTAIERAIEQTEQTVRGSYHRAVNSIQGYMFAQVLLACSLAPNDDMGYFIAGDVRGPLERVTGKHYEVAAFARHLKEFCSTDRGPLLKKSGQPKRYRYRFLNPLMEPFVVMKGLKDGIIQDLDLK